MTAAPVETKSILVVEDDADIRDVLVEVLELEGYEIAVAGNGREALEHLRRAKRPDLILLDLMMPVMDGWQFRAEQRQNPEWAGIPVVILTAHGSSHLKANSNGVAGFLKKHVELEDLLATVKQHCV
jgi:CheY-like chemotaxis protein